MPRNAAKEARLKEYCDREWLRVQKRAIDNVKAMQKDVSTPWNDRSVANVTNLKVFEGYGAERRARIGADAAPRQLTVVTVVPQIADPAQWEAEMRQINAGKPPVLEIQEVKPPEEG